MGVVDKVKVAVGAKPSKKVEPKAVDEAPEQPARQAKIQKHDPAEIRQMEFYINGLGAAHANDALRLFHRIINR